MTNLILRSALLCAFTAAACGSDDVPSAAPDAAAGPDASNPAVDAGPSEPLINGEPASAFYDRFVFQRTATHNEGAAEFPLVAGKNIYVVQFYLMANHDYLMFYSDGDGEVRGDGTFSIAVAPADMRRLSGTWRVDGSKLVLGALLSCDGLSLDGRPALRCRILTPPGSPGAPEGVASVWPYGLPTNPGDARWSDFH